MKILCVNQNLNLSHYKVIITNITNTEDYFCNVANLYMYSVCTVYVQYMHIYIWQHSRLKTKR